MATITHKQGDTLDWVINLTDTGSPVDLTDWSIRAQIRQGDTLIFNLTVTVVDAANGLFRLSATAAQTDTWSAGSHSCDVEFTDDSSNVFSTETFNVVILEDISHD
jgi:hypothetical protein